VWRLTAPQLTERFAGSLGDQVHARLLVVRVFEARHGALGASECAGFTTLPILGSSYAAENRYRLPVTEHASLTGDVHRQLRDLPDGTAVRIRIVP